MYTTNICSTRNVLMLCSYSPKKPNQKASGRGNSTQLHEYFVVCCLQRTAVRRPLIHSCAYCYSQRGDKLPHICSQIFVHLNFASICCYKCARHKWLDYICERTLLQQHISYIFFFGINVNLVIDTRRMYTMGFIICS